MYVYCTEK